MLRLSHEMPAEQRAVLSIDTSDTARASELAHMAKDLGAVVIKQGLELSSARRSSWEFCSQNAANAGLDWIADAKIHDIPNTSIRTVRNLLSLDHPPTAITVHAASGKKTMNIVQEIANEQDATILAVTELTSAEQRELNDIVQFLLARSGFRRQEVFAIRRKLVHIRALHADKAGVKGLVATVADLQNPIKKDKRLTDKITLVPAIRSLGSEFHDQQNVDTPYNAIINGADLLVIGRQVTKNNDPASEYNRIISEINSGIAESQLGKSHEQ